LVDVKLVRNQLTGLVFAYEDWVPYSFPSSICQIDVTAQGDIRVESTFDVGSVAGLDSARIVALKEVPGTPMMLVQLAARRSESPVVLAIEATRTADGRTVYSIVTTLTSAVGALQKYPDWWSPEVSIIETSNDRLAVARVPGATPGELVSTFFALDGVHWKVAKAETVAQDWQRNQLSAMPLPAQEVWRRQIDMSAAPGCGSSAVLATLNAAGELCLQFENCDKLFIASPPSYSAVSAKGLPVLSEEERPTEKAFLATDVVVTKAGRAPGLYSIVGRTTESLETLQQQRSYLDVSRDGQYVDYDSCGVEIGKLGHAHGGTIDRRPDGRWFERIRTADRAPNAACVVVESGPTPWGSRDVTIAIVGPGDAGQMMQASIPADIGSCDAGNGIVLLYDHGPDLWIAVPELRAVYQAEFEPGATDGGACEYAIDSVDRSVVWSFSYSTNTVRKIQIVLPRNLQDK
jgi:hypothetical protein